MENREIAIRLSGVKKMYRLGQIGGGTLTADLQSWWARVRGKEDPNTVIGTDRRLAGNTFMALNGIDLTVYKGEALGIIGSNGAGKSTMLKLLSRVTAPTEGEIGINGRIASMLEVGTGFNPEMTGRENVYLNGAILGMSKAEIDAKMEDIIEFSEVRDFIDTPVKRYSSGMYVKLAFAVAAHLDAEIMIMDEVLAVGDMAFQKKCLDKMRDAATVQGKTVLYVSHNMNTIRQLCERCVVLDKGRVVFVGNVDQAIDVYMGVKSNSSSVVDLSKMHRDPEFTPHPVTMLQLSAVDTELTYYPVGSRVTLKVLIACEKDISNAYLRLIVKTAEGAPVTMTTTAHGFALSKDACNELEVQIDSSHLAPGRFSLSPVVYEVNELGVNVNLDGLKEVFFFEMVTIPDFNNNMIWMPRYWGHTYCDPLRIVSMNTNREECSSNG